jgi:hypothetical protein
MRWRKPWVGALPSFSSAEIGMAVSNPCLSVVWTGLNHLAF